MLELLKDTAKKAGRLLKIRFLELLNGMETEVREKGKSDFVTRVDVEVENYIKELLANTNISVVGEESFKGEIPGTCIFIDPIDGTRNFMRKNPHFAINLAYQEKGKLLAGVTYDPMKNEMFSAAFSKGAFLNGERIYASTNKDIGKAIIAIGLPYRGRELIDIQTNLYRNIFLNGAATRHTGSAALDLAYISCGRYDAAIYFYLSPWDVAPGILLVEEAGGEVEGTMGREPIQGWIIASNKVIHPEVKDILEGSLKAV
ncbi:myo-inositol-1(or 4)-monophosphatase [Thermosulfidibacter takaii ABI70S6]|uniref:Inositol-1-monophosphatase n=1 Tax=Thermosulfidibacter takaii (strain DSM 17441 / JCM 13301 / NBRC 103674 / ABI70S6) TaxID=1298851 RepID=A0A0S3QSF0_THET7|nr:inositol monophosphatase family protein [Thermosulfidibacter takaii]BAT71229.1 myo-inositol-1(or 4)-monophosphatase [Thermosulfidibacter takaii ABI70S6]